MVNRFTLTGTGNDGFRHRYSVKKNEHFKKAFVKFMIDLGFDEKTLPLPWGDYEESGIHIDKKEGEIKVNEIEDICLNYNNRKYDLDVFYGRFKIIIVVRTKRRIPMVDYLVKKAGWIKPFKIKKLKERKGVSVGVKSPTVFWRRR